MRRFALLAILGLLLVDPSGGHAATATPSDWPSIGYDAAQSNDNTVEKSFTSSNVLKLKVRWTVALPSGVSYPIVSGGKVYVPFLTKGKVHFRALDAATGKRLFTYSQDAGGGLLAAGGSIYAAGHVLSVVDPEGGETITSVAGSSTSSRAGFAYPVSDRSTIVAGYADGNQSTVDSLYAVSGQTNSVVWKAASLSTQAAITGSRVVTATSSGTAFYDEQTGKRRHLTSNVFSEWFGSSGLAMTVASISRKNATLYAFNASGKRVWSVQVGPPTSAFGWPHAVTRTAIYVHTLTPHSAVEALDPATGKVLWSKSIGDIQRLAVANDLLFALTYGLGQPVRLAVFKATTGAPVGAVQLSTGYYAFSEANELMIAAGMVFIRAVGPSGSQLLALGL